MTPGAVLHVCDYAAPYLGNFLPSQLEVGVAVRERLGLECHFVFPDRARDRPWLAELQSRGFGYTFLDKRENRLRRGWTLRGIARQHNAVLLHSHYFAFDADCVLAAMGGGTKVVWHVRSGLEEYRLRNRISDLAKVRTLGRCCDMVMAVSEAAARDSIRRGFPRNKVRVIPNGIVLDRFRHPSRQRAGVRSQLKVDPEAVVVLSFCWTPERKGADLVVAAMEGLREDLSPRPVVLVVTGEERTRAYLEAMVGTPPPPWIVLTRPFEDVADLFAASDVFVSAAREDAFSYAIGEAMACGLPVVSSDIPGPSHYFPAEGVATFPTQDVSSLRRALGDVIRSDARSRLGAMNRRFVSERLSVERYVDRVLSAYGELLA